jgi:large subunit ribosomal protein L2
MAIVKCKPTSPGRRHLVKVVNKELHKGKPYAPLLDTKSKSGGRNNNGRITVRHIGGGHKHHYRIVDFKRTKDGIPAKVERLEYDPNRSANIALVLYADGERRYILAPKGLTAGDTIQSGVDAPIKAGNAMPLRNTPLGSVVHAIELKPGKGAQIARAAGTYCIILQKLNTQTLVLKFPSGEEKILFYNNLGTLGVVSNQNHKFINLKKAGRSFLKGRKPKVRGVAKNSVDHPHGGGRGRTSKLPVPSNFTRRVLKGVPSNKKCIKFLYKSRKK